MKIICLMSAKGGTGTSCVAAYLGAAFAAKQKRVLLAELSSPALDIITGAQNQAAYNMEDILEQGSTAAEVAASCALHPNLSLLPAASQLYRPDHQQVATFLETCRDEYDIVLVDLGTTPGDLSPLLAVADRILVVTSPHILSVRASGLLTAQMPPEMLPKARLVINKLPVNLIRSETLSDLDDVIDMSGVQLIGVIPYSRDIRYCSANGSPLEPSGRSAQIFECMVQRLQGEYIPLLIK